MSKHLGLMLSAALLIQTKTTTTLFLHLSPVVPRVNLIKSSKNTSGILQRERLSHDKEFDDQTAKHHRCKYLNGQLIQESIV